MSNLQLLKTLPNVQNVAANSTATIGVPVGVKSYEHIGLEQGGTTFTKAQVTNLEVLLNGSPIHQYATAVHLELISAYYGYDVNSDEIIVPFKRSYLTKDSEAERFNIGVADVATAQIQTDITGATAPTMAAFDRETIVRAANDDNATVVKKNRLGLFAKVKKFTHSLVGSGVTEIDNIPREAFLMALHMIQSSDVITKVEVWLDNQLVWDGSKTRMTNEVNRAGRAKQSNCYHVDFLLANELGGQLVLQGSQDFRLKVSHSGACDLTTYVEYQTSFSGF